MTILFLLTPDEPWDPHLEVYARNEESMLDWEGNMVPISLTPDGAAALVIKSPSMTLDEFLATPQCTHMFLPANKDGPDMVFWIMSSDETWYAVFVQSKYYQDKISAS